MTRLGYTNPKVPKATKSPTPRELEWAAGFLEGEGCFSGSRSLISASQSSREPLDRLQGLFGGSIGQYAYTSSWRKGGKKAYWLWTVTGSRARGVMMTLYSLLTIRRKEQIRQSLARDMMGSRRTL